jgi:predicted RNA binding protein YcfA (HicA-like mRNA interferase family)
MPLPARDVVAALQKKGFRSSNSKDRRFVYHRPDGTKTKVSTMVSHGEREIGDSLLGQMSRQMQISRAQLDEFVACSLSQATYDEHLKARGTVGSLT